MIDINRTFNSESGVQDIDELSGYIFSPESYAHRFLIARTDNYGYEGLITARLLRADGVTVIMTGSVNNMEEAEVILRPECYQVPGTFLLTIFHINDDEVECIYAGRGKAVQAESGMTILDAGSASSIEQQISRFIQDVGLVAVFARNVGDIEGSIATFQQSVDGIVQAMAAQDIRTLNGPNLLRKDAWWVNDGTNNLICGTDSRYSKSGGAYMKSITSYVIYTTEPTQEQTAGATYVYHREAYTDEGGTSYPEAWIVYRDADDGITTSYVDLTGAAIITDDDGEVYNNAIQYSIVANTAWGNMKTLFYPEGMTVQYYKQGEIPKSHGEYVEEMQVGKKYTVSCWARLTSGTEAWLKFGWGGQYKNGIGIPSDRSGQSGIYKVTGTQWQRLSWTFIFNPTGAEYTETTEQYTDPNDQTYTRVIRSYNWHKRVMIGVCRKETATLQLTGFRLTAGGLYGDNTVDTLQLTVDQALESIAPVETGPTASTAYAQGALLVWGGKLYKTSAAVAAGAAWAVGTNLTATTLAQELAAMAAQVAGV